MNEILITQDVLRKCESKTGGWPKVVVELLGGSYPLVEGWKDKLVGKRITREAYDNIIAIKDLPRSRRKQAAKEALFL